MKTLNQTFFFLKEIKFSGEIPNNWPNDLLGTSIHKPLEFSQYYSGLILLQ